MADHFTPVADQYAAFRPDYPDELYDWLADIAPRRECAWDCGAGSGQATLPLAKRFRHVYATDLSAAQLATAPSIANVEYRVAPAEASGLPDAAVDLITVAQALHWFDPVRFHAEVRRVARPGGLIAAWGYNRLRIGHPVIQKQLDDFYDGKIGPYWPAERIHVEQGYRDLPFPYTRLDTPEFSMRQQWTREHLLGYLRSWSAVARFKQAQGYDPVTAFAEEIEVHWPDHESLSIVWPMFLHIGKID